MSWPYARIADLRSTARGVRTRATGLAGVGTAAMVVQRDALLTQLLAAEADTPASPAECSAVNLDELTAIDVHVTPSRMPTGASRWTPTATRPGPARRSRTPPRRTRTC